MKTISWNIFNQSRLTSKHKMKYNSYPSIRTNFLNSLNLTILLLLKNNKKKLTASTFINLTSTKKCLSWLKIMKWTFTKDLYLNQTRNLCKNSCQIVHCTIKMIQSRHLNQANGTTMSWNALITSLCIKSWSNMNLNIPQV